MKQQQLKTIELNSLPIALYQLLKFESLVSSGGQAKIVIDDGLVSVNGQVELRRRKKVINGDVIEYAGQCFEVKLSP